MNDLSIKLTKREFRIITGFGSGVGSYVINGAIEQLQLEKNRGYEESLILRPFPQKPSGGKTKEQLWEQYRENMIQEAGVAVFVFGNKRNKEDGEIINADGVLKEFELAISNGVKIVPIVITSYQTKLLYDKVLESFEEYYPGMDRLRQFFELLGQSIDVNTIVSTTVKIIEDIRGIYE